MAYETGDIIIFDKWPGHVAMGYSAREMIHANHVRNFHKEPWMSEKDGKVSYAVSGSAKLYKCPWGKCPNAEAKKAELQAAADAIMAHATYGKYRAVRLFAGSSIYGPDAHSRFQKYRERQQRGYTSKSGKTKFVTTITCAEAVILSFQLAFADTGEPFFLRLDGAHTMPSTLGEYLTKTWGPGVTP